MYILPVELISYRFYSLKLPFSTLKDTASNQWVSSNLWTSFIYSLIFHQCEWSWLTTLHIANSEELTSVPLCSVISLAQQIKVFLFQSKPWLGRGVKVLNLSYIEMWLCFWGTKGLLRVCKTERENIQN